MRKITLPMPHRAACVLDSTSEMGKPRHRSTELQSVPQVAQLFSRECRFPCASLELEPSAICL